MKNTVITDVRLEKVAVLLQKYLQGDFSAREGSAEKGDEIDRIIQLTNRLGEKVQQSGQLIADYERRVTAIMNVLLKYTFFDFTEKAEVSNVGDEIDAIALALNTLGEELHDRLEIEKKQLEDLKKLAAVVESTADAVISMDQDGYITHWNQSATRIYGYTDQEMIGRQPMDVLTPQEDREEFEEIYEKAMRGEQMANVITRARKKDGTVIEVAVTLTPVYDAEGRLVTIASLSRDVTEQQKAEKVLRRSEEKFRTLVEGVKDYAIMMLDPEGNVVSWNEGAAAIKGYTAEEIMNRNFSIFYTPEDRKDGLPEKLLEEARARGKTTAEGFRVRKDGSSFWAYVVITCLYDDNQQVVGFSKIIRDLTETKEKDDKIRKYTLRVEQKNLELERTNNELASFAYVSSHDLQEPLRKIQTFASRILETDYRNLSEQGKDYFNRMNSSANRMQQLILDILDYSKLTTHNMKSEIKDLNELIDEVLEEYSDLLGEKKAIVSVEKLFHAPVIPYQFKQLISNLLSNALKFSSQSREPLITIRGEVVKAADLPYKVAYQRDRYCRITFSDNGIGFEPHFNRQIFEVFQRLHNQEVYKGTGIGLAICKKIVDNHNGLIEAKGQLDKGATFEIYLPLS